MYGYSHLLTLNNLEKVGLLKVQGQRSYPTVRKTLRLIVEDVNEQVTMATVESGGGHAGCVMRRVSEGQRVLSHCL